MSDLERRKYELFCAAVELPLSEWAKFLDENCETPELRSQVEALLETHAHRGEDLQSTALETFAHLTLPLGGQIEEFQLVRSVGMGGMGEVFLALDTVLKRRVALKIVTHRGGRGKTAEDALERFGREARAAARLAHPNVVKVYRSGETNGVSYIAMEYIEGETLGEWLEREEKSPSTSVHERCRRVAEIVMQIADALEHAHRAKVVHRDVKPSNILLESDGTARLADFGIARIATEETQGDVHGTFRYMSPEQAQVSKANIDHRTDIFSLGVVLYESICFERPFESSTFDEHLRVLSDCAPKPLRKSPKKIPTDLGVICHKAIEKDPVDRYQSAGHLSADINSFLNGMSILAQPPSIWRRTQILARKHQLRLLLATVLFLCLSLLAVGFAFKASYLEQQKKEMARMGQVNIGAAHRNSLVTIQVFQENMQLGEIIATGVAPYSTHLEPGLYRVTIENSSGRKLEATTFLEAGMVDDILVRPPKPAVLESMVVIPGNSYQLGSAEGTLLDAQRVVTLGSFLISPTEVSNREYREFVLATDSPSPSAWPLEYDESIDDLPVTDISWDQANAYCRWRGVRLPTPDEWEAAAQGPDGARFPWGDEKHEDIRREDSPNFDYAVYLEHAQPVNIDPLATPLDVKHMLSNVQEYTEGISTLHNNGVILKGRSWMGNPYTDRTRISVLTVRDRGSLDRGFRIATSNQ